MWVWGLSSRKSLDNSGVITLKKVGLRKTETCHNATNKHVGKIRLEERVRILFDLSATQSASRKFHGGAAYGHIILRKLLKSQKDKAISVSYNPDRWLDPQLQKRIHESAAQVFYVKDKQDLQRLLDQDQCDRLYSPMPYAYHSLDFNRVEIIFTIHGLRLIEMPMDRYELVYDSSLYSLLKYVYRKLCTRKYVRGKQKLFTEILNTVARRKIFIVDSYHTKYSILSYFPELRPGELRVLYAPRKRCLCPGEVTLGIETLKKYKVSHRQYFLLISAGRWNKNAYRAIRALDEVFSDHPDVDKKALILGVNEPDVFKRHVHNEDRFVFDGYVDELALEELFKHAYALIFPTLNEGFGYPPLEAMKYGTPSLCSAITSTTEVYGDAVLYFSPFSIKEIKSRILWMLFEDGVWEQYSASGKERSRLIAAKQDADLKEICRLILTPW